jgi:hypothetical protein
MDSVSVAAHESQQLVASIRPLLAGRPPDIIGAALADLLAILLAGHYQGGDELIETMLEMHIAAVRALVPVNIQMIKQRARADLNG